MHAAVRDSLNFRAYSAASRSGLRSGILICSTNLGDRLLKLRPLTCRDILHLPTFNPVHQPPTCAILGMRSSAMSGLPRRWRRSSTKNHIRNASTHEKLFAWIEASGKRLVGPTREVYLDGPNEIFPRRAFDRGICSNRILFDLCFRSLILKFRRHQSFTNPRSNTSDRMIAIMENVKMTR